MRAGGRLFRPDAAVMTAMRFAAPAERVWDGLMFYEQILRRPPLLLRLLLPTPLRAEGSRSVVGDETRCVYEGGHLVKRVIRIEPGRHYGFDVVEQSLRIGPGIRLLGGAYRLVDLPDGKTRLELTTRYASSRRPGWLWRPIEAAVCHVFHRHLLGAMRRAAEAHGAALGEAEPL